MKREALDELKRQIPLFNYLQAHDWRPVRHLSRGRWMGLCPLHQDHHPSFVVDPNKGLFYCYGCGRGGDVIRFAEIYHEVRFPQALALLRQWRGLRRYWRKRRDSIVCSYIGTARRLSISINAESAHRKSSITCESAMRPARACAAWLMDLGHPLAALSQAGLVTCHGLRCYVHRIVFPLDGNLYGRSISASAPPHRFLPGSKGGLY